MRGHAVYQVAVKTLAQFPCGLQFQLHLAILSKCLHRNFRATPRV